MIRKVKVEATKIGFYNNMMVSVGQVLTIPIHCVSDKWHKVLSPDVTREDVLRARARVKAKANLVREGVRIKVEEDARFEAQYQAKIEKEENERVRTEYAAELRTKTEKEEQAKAEQKARDEIEAERLAKEEAEVQARLEAEKNVGTLPDVNEKDMKLPEE